MVSHPILVHLRDIHFLISEMSDTNTHPQCQSKLTSAPPEIRRAIYALLLPSHVHLSQSSQGRPRLSTCLEPPVGSASILSIRMYLRAPIWCPPGFTPVLNHPFMMTLETFFACDHRGGRTAHAKRQLGWPVTTDCSQSSPYARRCKHPHRASVQRH